MIMTVRTRGSPIGGSDSQGQTSDGQSQQNQISSDSSNENSQGTPPDEQGQGDAPPQHEDEDVSFPHSYLANLNDMINRISLCSAGWPETCEVFELIDPPASTS